MQEIKPAAMKIKEAAQYLNLGAGTLRRLSDLGKIPCKKLGRERYFIVSELDQWMKSQEDWADGNTPQAQGQVGSGFQATDGLGKAVWLRQVPPGIRKKDGSAGRA